MDSIPGVCQPEVAEQIDRNPNIVNTKERGFKMAFLNIVSLPKKN